jgi:hypothetical protein
LDWYTYVETGWAKYRDNGVHLCEFREKKRVGESQPDIQSFRCDASTDLQVGNYASWRLQDTGSPTVWTIQINFFDGTNWHDRPNWDMNTSYDTGQASAEAEKQGYNTALNDDRENLQYYTEIRGNGWADWPGQNCLKNEANGEYYWHQQSSNSFTINDNPHSCWKEGSIMAGRRVSRVVVSLGVAAALLAVGAVGFFNRSAFSASAPQPSASGSTVFVPQGATAPSDYPAVPPTDGPSRIPDLAFQYPLGYSEEKISTVEEGKMAFVPVALPGLGNPIAMFASDPTATPRSREIAWSYEDPSLGSIVVVESLGFQTEAQFEAPAKATPGCTMTWNADHTGFTADCVGGGDSLVETSGGPALVRTGAGVSIAEWFSPVKVTDQSAIDGMPSNVGLDVEVFARSELSPSELGRLVDEATPPAQS